MARRYVAIGSLRLAKIVPLVTQNWGRQALQSQSLRLASV